MTEPTLKQWKRRALAAQEELATIQRMRSMDAAREMEMARENAALQEQAREGEVVANSAILARGRFHTFKGEDGEPDDWEWFEEGTNCEHGCIDAVIVRADAITAPQPAQSESIECDCGRIHKKTRYGWACSEPAQPEQVDIADIIAGALNVSRGTAYDLLRWRHQPAQPVAQPLTDEDCTRIYNEANNITIKNPPITTARVFAAMRAAHTQWRTK